jgi:hypothetical protein
MDKPGYTPGPWFLINDHCVGGPIEPGWEEAGCGVAHCGMRARTAEEATANARLIAAAPDLVEAMARLITAAKMLLANAEGCAANHHGYDMEIHGPPGWLADCANDIESARVALSKALGGDR